jgi:pyruvate dehydrogenase E1 component alpha subunit
MEIRELYRHMCRSRAFELALADLWQRGLISGEMHLGTGEEAIAAGVIGHLRDGDGLAVDHRSTPPLVVRGVDMAAMLKESLGWDGGLSRGRGGHMHLFAPERITASSGIVGASAPTAAGFALAAKRLRTGSIGLALLGEGALNAGMVLETFNLAAVWSLPMVMVCKHNDWSVTTRSSSVTAGKLVDRARAFGWSAEEVDGRDVVEVDRIAGAAIERARRGKPPAFLLAECGRLDGHFLGDAMVRAARGEDPASIKKMVGGLLAGGSRSVAGRARSLGTAMSTMVRARGGGRDSKDDPLVVTSIKYGKGDDLAAIEEAAAREVATVVDSVLREAGDD